MFGIQTGGGSNIYVYSGKNIPTFFRDCLKSNKNEAFFHGTRSIAASSVFTGSFYSKGSPSSYARFKFCAQPLFFTQLHAKNKVIFYRTKVLPPHNKALFYPSRRRISGPLQGATDNIFFYRTGILHLPVLQKHAAGQKRNDGKLLNTN